MYLSIVIFASIYLCCLVEAKKTLFEDDACVSSDGTRGFCKRLDSCVTGQMSLKSGRAPKICSFIGDHPVVCCPLVELTTRVTPSDEQFFTTSSIPPTWGPQQTFDVSSQPPQVSSKKSPVEIARLKCAEYARDIIMEVDSPVLTTTGEGRKETIDTCARVEEPLVVGGENAKAREYPHMALIGYRETNVEWLCGGSLISERFVLSAAHCSRPASKGPALWAKLGELDTSTENDDAKPEIIRIIQRIDNPKYSSVTLYNDLSLFKLERAVSIGPYVRPICLATSQDIPQQQAIAAGWGHTSWDEKIKYVPLTNLTKAGNESEEANEQDEVIREAKLADLYDIRYEIHLSLENESGTASPSLMKVKLNLVTNEDCNEAFRKSRGKQIPRGILKNSQICAGDEAGKDTCQGDSGGPLQIPIKEPYCMYDLIGITSFGRSCGNGYPGVYTRVSNFLPWIVKNVWPELS